MDAVILLCARSPALLPILTRDDKVFKVQTIPLKVADPCGKLPGTGKLCADSTVLERDNRPVFFCVLHKHLNKSVWVLPP